MSHKMLIDGNHPEETRVVVVSGNKVEDFDFESAKKRQVSGNIYLAKVTRVEPSLQAAFLDYGGNRHGFLAFSEILSHFFSMYRDNLSFPEHFCEIPAKFRQNSGKFHQNFAEKAQNPSKNASEK